MTVNRRFPGRLREDLFTGTDLVKMIVILSFSAVSFMLTVIAPDYGIYPANSLIYCIPILLAALWYPGQGFRVTALLVAGFALIRVADNVFYIRFFFGGKAPFEPCGEKGAAAAL